MEGWGGVGGWDETGGLECSGRTGTSAVSVSMCSCGSSWESGLSLSSWSPNTGRSSAALQLL